AGGWGSWVGGSGGRGGGKGYGALRARPCRDRMPAMPVDRKARIHAVARVSSGNFLEMYDFMVFGYYAAAIGRAFFPSGNAYTSLMLSLMTFGAGFLLLPLGPLVLRAHTAKP